MLKASINFNCTLCGNGTFYLMPLDKKTLSEDIIQSPNKFRAKCKKCGKNHIITLNVEVET